MKLSDLAKKYKTDRFGKHSYTSEYESLFEPSKVRKIVELGTAEGAGLKMWHDYFPNAEIHGADINPERVPQSLLKEYPRIRMHSCDQRFAIECQELIKSVGSDIDLFIDDGSHKPEDQVFTAKVIMPLLDKKSIYVIEDVAERKIFDMFPDFEAEMMEFYQKSRRYDDTLIILRHKNA